MTDLLFFYSFVITKVLYARKSYFYNILYFYKSLWKFFLNNSIFFYKWPVYGFFIFYFDLLLIGRWTLIIPEEILNWFLHYNLDLGFETHSALLISDLFKQIYKSSFVEKLVDLVSMGRHQVLQLFVLFLVFARLLLIRYFFKDLNVNRTLVPQ